MARDIGQTGRHDASYPTPIQVVSGQCDNRGLCPMQESPLGVIPTIPSHFPFQSCCVQVSDRAKDNATRLITGYRDGSIKTWFTEKYPTDADMGPQDLVYTRFERLVATHTSHMLITSYSDLEALDRQAGTTHHRPPLSKSSVVSAITAACALCRKVLLV